jgi:HEAT repeat protein
VNKIVEGTQSSNPEVKRVSKEMLNRVVASEPNKVKYYTEKIAETAVSNGDIYLFEVLGRIGSPDAIPILEPLKNDKKKNIRMAAEKTMDEIQESQSESGS